LLWLLKPTKAEVVIAESKHIVADVDEESSSTLAPSTETAIIEDELFPASIPAYIEPEVEVSAYAANEFINLSQESSDHSSISQPDASVAESTEVVVDEEPVSAAHKLSESSVIVETVICSEAATIGDECFTAGIEVESEIDASPDLELTTDLTQESSSLSERIIEKEDAMITYDDEP
jgi:hypothetical protein